MADLSLNTRFSNFLKRAYSIIFGRFFSKSIFSFGFIFSAAIISLFSFAIVITFQTNLYPQIFSEIKYDSTQIILIISFILFNVIFDYFTIVQTKVFIEASLKSNTISRSILFIASDLIVTMNTFILAYAAFLLLVVQVFISYPIQATVLVRESEPPTKITADEERRIFEEIENKEYRNKIKYRGSMSGALFSEKDMSDLEGLYFSYYSTFDPSNPEIQASIIASLASLNISNFDMNQITDEREVLNIENQLKQLDQRLYLITDQNDEMREIYNVTFDVDGSVLKNGSLDPAYTSAFLLADELEDGFPASLIGPIGLPRLSSLIQSVVSPAYNPLPTAICFERRLPIGRMLLSEQGIELISRCEDFITFDFVWVNSLDTDLALVGRNLSPYRIPFNTLLVTSMLPTAFFYLSIILLAIATLLFSKVIRGTNRVKVFFLRAPLSIAGLFLGVLLGAFGLI
ncbi:hypothetical protein [Martelella endophytica]|uniref:hypothetical protein n=1 Tax=Martelella endophytica TaxID=1486262 RepID=UPI00130DC6FB|nr:hypothetical protein [Martelella endophytica]